MVNLPLICLGEHKSYLLIHLDVLKITPVRFNQILALLACFDYNKKRLVFFKTLLTEIAWIQFLHFAYLQGSLSRFLEDRHFDWDMQVYWIQKEWKEEIFTLKGSDGKEMKCFTLINFICNTLYGLANGGSDDILLSDGGGGYGLGRSPREEKKEKKIRFLHLIIIINNEMA